MNSVQFQMVGTHLKFSEEVSVDLRSATSFRVKRHGIHQIEVERQDQFEGKIYETLFRLCFESAEQVHLCISLFMAETKMTPHLFFTRSVKPIVSTTQEEKTKEASLSGGRAAIEFEFPDASDLDQFLKYGAPQIPDFKPEKLKGESCTFVCTVEEDPNKQVDRIKRVFSTLLKRFESCGISNALIQCKDRRFATEPIVHEPSDFDRPPSGQRKEFHVTKSQISELFYGVHLKVETQNTTTWFKKAEFDRVKAMFKYEEYLAEKIGQAIKKNDQEACQKWLAAVGSTPALNAIRVLKMIK